MSFNLVLALAAKRVALGNSQTIACLDVSTAFPHADMKDEVYIKMNEDTFRLIREESSNLPHLQPFDDEGYYQVDKALCGYRGSPRFWKDVEAEAAKDLGLKPSKIDNSLYMDPGKLHPVRVRGRRNSVRRRQNCTRHGPKAKTTFLGEAGGLPGQSWRHN